MRQLLALVLAAQVGGEGRLPPAPVKLWQVAWQRPLVQAPPLEWKARELGGPAADPVTGLVIVGTRDGWLHAYDAEGAFVWSFQAAARFDAPPRIEGDSVYAGSNDGKLYALELASGKLRWKYDAQEEVGTTPVVAGDLVLAMTLQDTLFAVDAKTGAWKWHHRREGREGFTVRGAAAALVSGSSAVGAYSDGTVVVLEVATGTVRWERKIAPAGDVMDVDSTRLQSGRLYAAAYSGGIYCLDLETGRQIWEVRTPSPVRLTVGPGVIVGVTTTQVIGISQQDGTVRWTVPLDGVPWGDPVIVSGLVIVPNERSLLWIDVVGGRIIRSLDPGTGVSAGPARLGKRLYVLSNGGVLVALDVT